MHARTPRRRGLKRGFYNLELHPQDEDLPDEALPAAHPRKKQRLDDCDDSSVGSRASLSDE